ncbi:MAG: nucleotide exchange factor GrpE, partial [Verrucomicrobiales bacterium]
FGDSLGAFDSELKRWSDEGTRASKSSASTECHDTAKALRLPLVEMADRIHRLRDSFKKAPAEKAGWFGQRVVNAWQSAWKKREQAIQLLAEQAGALLSAAGLTPIPAEGRPFDPTLMIAVARDETSGEGGSLVVMEEITRGYFYQNDIVRLAEVRVARQQSLS